MGTVLTILLVVGAVALLVLATGVRKEHRRARYVDNVHGARPLGDYELAYLAGGPRRAVNTALAALAARGEVRVARGGTVTGVAGAASSADPIEHAVLQAVNASPGGRSAGEVRHEVGNGPAMDALAEHLRRDGLLLRRDAVHGAVRLNGWLLGASIGLLGLAVVATVSLVTGADTGGQAFAALVLAGLGFLGHRAFRRRLAGSLTTAGAYALERARRRHPRPRTSLGVQTSAHLALAPVGLYGLTAFPDQETADALGTRRDDSGAGQACSSGACGGAHGGEPGTGDWTCGTGASCSGSSCGASGSWGGGGGGADGGSGGGCGGGGGGCGGGGG
ncbi:TIGR04222 domain-containing membrane protein [Bailinhaonella thermotolerans]|uniref:TIGR04222 domain-containing membrane protein n=1 Tax=Bailinhaonella thermotolerans TaxID=1070861 RepID=UPI00192A5137|nr:TIGR04222 domain-containing membrane protein [Bailinhaonella thermotolerans]